MQLIGLKHSASKIIATGSTPDRFHSRLVKHPQETVISFYSFYLMYWFPGNRIVFVHTKLTKIAYWIMVINTFVSFTSLLATVTTLETSLIDSNLVLVTLFIVLVINACICIAVYRSSLLALRFSSWFYAIQIISYESQSLSFNLNTGLQLTLSWPVSTGMFAINFAILAISVLLHVACASVKDQTSAA